MSEKELEHMLPVGVEVTAGGETLTITPIKVKEFSAFTRAIAPLVDTFNNAQKENLVTELILSNTDALITATAIAVRKPAEWINELDIDELAALVSAVIEVNTDFFMTRVLPIVTAGMNRLTDRLNPGQKPT